MTSLVNNMQIKIKKLVEEAVIPTYAHSTDAGMDLTAVSRSFDEYGNVVYGTGLAFAIPEGHVGLLFPRSSNTKKDLHLGNAVGVLDSGYRGEVLLKFKQSLSYQESEYGEEYDFGNTYKTITSSDPEYFSKNIYEVGERVAQLIVIPYPKVEFEEADSLEETERGKGGFGSTNIK